jgi:hypothetical protein
MLGCPAAGRNPAARYVASSGADLWNSLSFQIIALNNGSHLKIDKNVEYPLNRLSGESIPFHPAAAGK